jgi:hypothetical protein
MNVLTPALLADLDAVVSSARDDAAVRGLVRDLGEVQLQWPVPTSRNCWR